MSIKLIVDGKELTNLTQPALKWFLKSVRDGKEGPFTVQTWKGTRQAIILTVPLTKQTKLF